MTEKFEFIDAEYAAYQESDDEHVPSIVKMSAKRWFRASRRNGYRRGRRNPPPPVSKPRARPGSGRQLSMR